MNTQGNLIHSCSPIAVLPELGITITFGFKNSMKRPHNF